MIKVVSYLRNARGGFTDVREMSRYEGDVDYVEGAVELAVDGVPVIDVSMWDYVDELWAYMVGMLVKLHAGEDARISFPDQPIKLEFSTMPGGRVRVFCDAGDGKRVAVTNLRDFLVVLSRAGALFFERAAEIIPANSGGYQREVMRLQSVMSAS